MAFVIPMDRLVNGRRWPAGFLPQRQHAIGGFLREVVEEARQIMHPFHRLSDGRIEEQQYTLDHGGGHAKRFGRDNYRLAGRIARDPFSQAAVDAKRALEDAAEFAGIVLQCCGLQPANDFA